MSKQESKLYGKKCDVTHDFVFRKPGLFVSKGNHLTLENQRGSLNICSIKTISPIRWKVSNCILKAMFATQNKKCKFIQNSIKLQYLDYLFFANGTNR